MDRDSTGGGSMTADGSGALIDILGHAETALASGDMESADAAMQAGADLCRRLQAAGIAVPASELAAVRDMAERCGMELARLTTELNADSAKGENFRRGMASYGQSG